MINSNLIIGIDEDSEIAAEFSVLTLKTTEKGNIIVQLDVPKCAVKLEDLEKAVNELRLFVAQKSYIAHKESSVSNNSSGLLTIEYGNSAEN
jgi:hypothetical protein